MTLASSIARDASPDVSSYPSRIAANARATSVRGVTERDRQTFGKCGSNCWLWQPPSKKCRQSSGRTRGNPGLPADPGRRGLPGNAAVSVRTAVGHHSHHLDLATSCPADALARRTYGHVGGRLDLGSFRPFPDPARHTWAQSDRERRATGL